MDASYIKLLREIAHNCEMLSERVMDLDRKNNDAHGLEVATQMRNDYAHLYDRMRADNFDYHTLTRNDFLKLLAGTYITVNNFDDQIKTLQRANQGYRLNVVPKLQRIMEETQDDESALNLADEIFKVSD